MLSSLKIALFVFIFIFAAAAATETPKVKESAGAAHYGGYGAAPPPPPSPIGYGAAPLPVFNFPNFDVNYCSVHASFPLIGLSDRHHHHYPHNHHDRTKRQAYGAPIQDSASSFNGPAYGPTFIQRPRRFERQGCRNTAIYSFDSCNRCCQIASKASGSTSPSVGLLLAFDPKLTANKKFNKNENINEADRAVQCVCCTSRRV